MTRRSCNCDGRSRVAKGMRSTELGVCSNGRGSEKVDLGSARGGRIDSTGGRDRGRRILACSGISESQTMCA